MPTPKRYRFPEGINVWMYSRNPALGGRSPMEMIVDGRTDEVFDLIDSLKPPRRITGDS